MNRLLLSFLLGTALLAGCRSPVARSVAVIPLVAPATESTCDATLSDAAAFRVWQEIDRHGFAAILEDATATPEECRLVKRADADADLRVFVWVQVVDLPREDYPEEPARAWGGLVLVGRDGRVLARSVDLREEPGDPSDAFHRVADPAEPRAREAAAEFGARALTRPGAFRDALRAVPPGNA